MQNTKQANRQTYDAIATKYEENYGNIPAAIEYAEYVVEQVKQIAKPRILDLGCGTGTILKIFEETISEAELVGVDFSEELLKIARTKLMGAKLICQDFASFGDTQKYDVVIATFSLIHSTDAELELMIPKVYEMLNDNGYFYASFILGKGEKMEPEALDPTQKTYFNFHNEKYLKDLFARNKFKVVKQKVVHSQDEYENEDDIYLVLQK